MDCIDPRLIASELKYEKNYKYEFQIIKSKLFNKTYSQQPEKKYL